MSRPTFGNSYGMGSTYGTMGSSYSSPYGASYGGGGYGGYGSSMYGSGGYNSYGGYGSSMYGGGGYGSYGGYGGGYGGGGYGQYGGQFDPNNPNLSQQMVGSTQATFQFIQSIVGAFGGFAQMLESTFMATHSSFFAMVSVAEQLGHLRNTLGSVLGIFAILRWMRSLSAKLTGRPLPDAEINAENFISWSSSTAPDGGAAPPARPKMSKKPLLIFLFAAIGMPYLMSKLIRSLTAKEEQERKRIADLQAQQAAGEVIDPQKLEFARAAYDFQPGNEQMELALRKGELVAVLAKTDPMGNSSQWWRGRSRDGKIGYFPSNYVEVVPRKQELQKQIEAQVPATPAGNPAGTGQQGKPLVEEFQRTFANSSAG